MADFILLNEDFSDFPIGEFPYDKNHSAMGEYHFIHYPGYYGKWYDPVCNHVYNGQGASWIISEYNGKHFMEQMRIRNDKPHRTFPMLTSGDRFWRDYTITASVRMFTTKWGNAGITPFGSKHTDTCSYSIITPESVAACKHRKSPVGLVIADTHLLHKMFSIIFRNNPGSPLTVINVVAYRVIPFTIISGIMDKMILTHCRMILIIREFTNGKIREIFIK